MRATWSSSLRSVLSWDTRDGTAGREDLVWGSHINFYVCVCGFFGTILIFLLYNARTSKII